jgi:hypothetical protein
VTIYNDKREETYYIVSCDSIYTLTLQMLVIITNNLQIGCIVRKKKRLKLLSWKICILQMIEDFAENDEIKNLEFGKQLEEIINLMES